MMRIGKKNPICILCYLVLLVVSMSIVVADYNDKNEDILGTLFDLNNLTYSHIDISDSEILVTIEASDADEFDTQLVSWFGLIFVNAGFLQGENHDYEYIIIEVTINDEPVSYFSTTRNSVLDYIDGIIDDELFWTEVTITSTKPSYNSIDAGTMLSKNLLGTDTGGFSFNFFIPWYIFVIIGILIAGVFIVLRKAKKDSKDSSVKKNKESVSAKNKNNESMNTFKQSCATFGKKVDEGIMQGGQFIVDNVVKYSKKGYTASKNYYDTKGKHDLQKLATKSKSIAKASGEKISKVSKDVQAKGKKLLDKKKNNSKKSNSKKN